MSTIAYHDRFADITSRSEARDLMQIMPSVARQFDVSGESPIRETNVRLANKRCRRYVVAQVQRTPEKDRMSIILASYNGGIGHERCPLPGHLNGNPNSWWWWPVTSV